jgi:hypothetical protein
VNRVHLHASMADGFGGMYLFPSVATFAEGTPDVFRQAFDAGDTRMPANLGLSFRTTGPWHEG